MTHEPFILRRRRRLCQGPLRADRRGDATGHRLGFTRSDVVYDVVHVFKGGFFRLADHLDRFERSMEKRRIHPPEDRAAIETVLHRCVALTGLSDAYVAMVASRGRPRVAGSRRPADCENHLIAYALPWIDVVPKDV